VAPGRSYPSRSSWRRWRRCSPASSEPSYG
jgi:hypothetical protein